MLKTATIIRAAEIRHDKALKPTPAYRAPRVIELGKASALLQGYTYGGFRDAYGWYSFSPFR